MSALDKAEVMMMVEPVHPQFKDHPKLSADARQSRIKNMTIPEMERACRLLGSNVTDVLDFLGFDLRHPIYNTREFIAQCDQEMALFGDLPCR